MAFVVASERWRRSDRPWRVDETYVRVKGRWSYLYRAIASRGATIAFVLSALRDAAAARRLFRNKPNASLRGESRLPRANRVPRATPVPSERSSAPSRDPLHRSGPRRR